MAWEEPLELRLCPLVPHRGTPLPPTPQSPLRASGLGQGFPLGPPHTRAPWASSAPHPSVPREWGGCTPGRWVHPPAERLCASPGAAHPERPAPADPRSAVPPERGSAPPVGGSERRGTRLMTGRQEVTHIG